MYLKLCCFIISLGSVHILHHHVRGGVGGHDTNDDIDDALRGGGGVTIKMMM